MEPELSADKRGRALRVAGTLLATALLVYLLSRQGWGEVVASIRRISLAHFLLVVGMAFVSRLAVTGRWSALLRSSDEVGLDQLTILRITFAGMFASNFLPTSVGGDIVRLANTLKVRGDRRVYATSIIVDRLVGALGMAMLLPIGFLELWMHSGLGALGGGLASLPVIGAGIETSMLGGVQSRLRRGFAMTWEAVRLWMAAPRAIALSLGFTWVHMIIKFSAMWVLFNALGESIGYLQMAGLWSLVYFITLFPVSINGIGLQEVSAAFIYSTFGGMALSSGLTVALLIRTAEMLASLPGALALPGLIGGEREAARPRSSVERPG